jgi:hypothetical protein
MAWGWEPVAAAVGLGAVCVLWWLIQRVAGREARGCGACSCGAGACDRNGLNVNEKRGG